VETESSGYRQRTKHNVRDADATLIIYRGRLEGGSLLTRDLATGHGKPLLLCDLHAPTEELLAAWQDWLVSHPIAILNIAGPSEARNPGIYLQASALLGLSGVRNMSRSDARCATPYIYSGELQIRPEVDAALAALKDNPTPPSQLENDGTGAMDSGRRRRNRALHHQRPIDNLS